MKGAPGDPTFTGTLSADGKTMTGDFTQGPGTFAFKFSRTGDPKIEEVKASPAVAKDFLGTWEGTLEGPGLRLMLKMSNDASGAKAVLISVDQGGAEFPVSVIDQKGSKLMLLVRQRLAGYVGFSETTAKLRRALLPDPRHLETGAEPGRNQLWALTNSPCHYEFIAADPSGGPEPRREAVLK